MRFKKKYEKLLILPYTQHWKLRNHRNVSPLSNSEDLKITKIWTERKTESFKYDLKEKVKVSEISEFSILPYTQVRKSSSEISTISFNSNFDTGCNTKISEIFEFLVFPYTQNPNSKI